MTSVALACTVFVLSVLINCSLCVNIESNSGSGDKQDAYSKNANSRPILVADDKPDHMMWFIQISDIHISIFHDPTRISDLRVFLNETLEAIKPKVVLASGDLTDARDKDLMGSRQYESEWRIYYDLVKSADVENRTLWLDMRGNHDNFNVAKEMKNGNFFEQYSIQGKENKHSYMKQFRSESGEIYTFIAVDACLPIGLKRPLNFVGILSNNDTEHLRQMANNARDAGGDYIIWFGHYPTSCIATVGVGTHSLKQVVGEFPEGLVYMSGHLHTAGDFSRHMYAMHPEGFLELEVADWKVNRVFRIAAIDHGIFSFIDVTHNKWPIVLITNPKHALFHLPHRNESNIQLESTHIRILAFSPSGILNCSVEINNVYLGQCQKATDYLFVLKWDPKSYKDEIHTIAVTVFDQSGRMNKVTQPFKFDDRHKLSFEFIARIILMNDVRTVFQCIYFLMLFAILFPLIFFRIWHCLIVAGKLNRNGMYWCRSYPIIRKYWILSTIDRVFWPIIIYWVYVTFGPWAIAEVIDDHYGIMFIWGVYIDEHITPGSFTYLYGALQLFLCQLPLIIIFSACIEKRFLIYIGKPKQKRIGSIRSLPLFSQAPFFFILAVEMLLAVCFGISYGAVAFFLTPTRTWSVVMNLLLWYLSRNMPEYCYRSAALVWGDKDAACYRKNSNEEASGSDEIRL